MGVQIPRSPTKRPSMSDLFISYSRNDKAFVKRLHDALERRELEAWVDWEGIPPTAEWLREVYGAIDASQAFVFVLSRASNSSEVCGKELKRALAQNKRLVPIVCEELTAESAPEALAKLNWIFLRDEDDFDSGIDTFVESLNTDLDRVKAHTRLLVRAVEWDSRQQHHSLLLRSRDLEEGEKRFVGEADKDPNPTALQLRFVRASRRRSTKLQRLVLGSVTLAGLVATALAIIAWVERQHSERRASAAFVQVIADAKPLSALAHAVVETGEWFADDVPEIRSSLLSALQMSKERMRLVDSGERPIHRVALSANGITAAALDPLFVRDRANESLLVWDAQGKPIAFDPVGSPITALAACDAESLLVVGSRDGTLHLWDAETRQPAGAAPYAEPIESSNAAPNESVAATPSTSSLDVYGEATAPPRLERSPGRQAAARCTPASASIHEIAVSPDCQWIAVSRDCATELWSRSPELRLARVLPEARVATAVAFDTSARVVVRGFADGSLKKASRSGRGEFADADFARHPFAGPVHALAVSPDGAHVASADGSAVRLWTVEGDKGRQTAEGFHGHGNTVSTLAFDPAGRQVIGGSHDNSIRIWDLGGNPLGEPLLGHDGWIRSLAVSAEGREIVSAGNDGTVRRWELSRSLSTRSCADTEGTASVLAVDDAGTSLIQRRGDDHRFEIYLQNRECDRSPVAVVDQVHVAAMTPDGRVVAYGALGGRSLTVRPSIGSSDAVEHSHPESGLRAIALSPDGDAVAVGGNSNVVSVWSARDRSFVSYPQEHKRPIVSLAFSRDGRFLASGSEDNTIQLWDLETGEKTGPRFQGHYGWVSAIAFSHDGEFVASGSWDKTVRLWDRDGHQMGRPFRGHTDRITFIGFEPGLERVVSHGYDRRVGTWPGGDPGSWLRESCAQLDIEMSDSGTEESELFRRARDTCLRLLPESTYPRSRGGDRATAGSH